MDLDGCIILPDISKEEFDDVVKMVEKDFM